MTRETKVGLVVSCSFLCLVGAVLYCKMKEPKLLKSEYAKQDGSIELPADPTPDEGAPQASGASTSKTPKTLPLSIQQVGAVLPTPDPDQAGAGTPNDKKDKSFSPAGTTAGPSWGTPPLDMKEPASTDKKPGNVSNDGAAAQARPSKPDVAASIRGRNDSPKVDRVTPAPSSNTDPMPPSAELEDDRPLSGPGSPATAAPAQAKPTDSGFKMPDFGKKDPVPAGSAVVNSDQTPAPGGTKDSAATGEPKFPALPDTAKTSTKPSAVTGTSTAATATGTTPSPSGTTTTPATTATTDPGLPAGKETFPSPAPLATPATGTNPAASSGPVATPMAGAAGTSPSPSATSAVPAMSPTAGATTAAGPGSAPAGTTGMTSAPASSGAADNTSAVASTGSPPQATATGSRPLIMPAPPSAGTSGVGTSATLLAPMPGDPSQGAPRSQPGDSNPLPAKSDSVVGLAPGETPTRPIPSPPMGDDAPARPESGVRLLNPPADSGSATLLAQGPPPPSAGVGTSGGDRLRPMPPLGASPVAAAPPISVPSASSAVPDTRADVESYDVEAYPWQQGDTLSSLAIAKYGSPTYEQALLRYNRADLRAPEGIRQEPPVLRPGDSLLIPSREFMDKHYGNGTAPAPVASGFGAGGSAPPAPGVAASERTYTVMPKDGEPFMAIAGHELKNPNRWWDIARLNTNYDPKYPVPAGSKLRMPADWSPTP